MSNIHGLHGMQAMTDLAITRAMVTELIPLPTASTGPEQAARLVHALPRRPAQQPPAPAPEPGLAVSLASGRMLAAAGPAARARQFRYFGSSGDLCTEVMVISPAAVGRGDARISAEGTVRWEYRFADPDNSGGGLIPAQAAGAIAAALQDYRAGGPGQHDGPGLRPYRPRLCCATEAAHSCGRQAGPARPTSRRSRRPGCWPTAAG